ncbi:MAG TPA: DUF2141 domain-containing protein [Novosphingobium sp.]|nr:DUF2141 domain-containing protein [Novosphingobium sp.]
MAALLVSAQTTPKDVPPKELRGRVQASCRNPEPGPAFRLIVRGLKDRKGQLQLELYPADDKDFLAPDKELIAAGKPFKRVNRPIPASGDPVICVRAPGPGRFALAVLHDRDRNGKFGVMGDGVGFPGDPKLSRSKPSAAAASLRAQQGVTETEVTLQYRRGLTFRPLS